MDTRTWQTSLTYRLGRTVLPLSAIAALLLALSAPVAWFALKYSELSMRSEGLAARISAEMSQFVHDAPVLWPYNTPKITQRLQSLLSLDDQTYVAVIAPNGAITYQRPSREAPFVWHTASLTTESGPRGWVVVGVSARDFLASALLLLAGFALLGGVVAGLLYLLPMRAMRSTEDQLASTLQNLNAAQERLQDANQDLETRVREKTRGLLEAHDQLEDQQKALQRLAASLYSAQKEERHRIATDLHDSVGQMLTAIRLNLEAAGQMQPDQDAPTPLNNLLQHTSDLVNQTTDSIRQAIHLLGPPQLQEGGLKRALKGLERQLEMTPYLIAIDCSGLPEERLPAAVEDLAFRFVQEGINNALKHGGAQEIKVRLKAVGETLAVVVEDDGDVDSPTFREGHGLASLRDRIALLGGEVRCKELPSGHAVAAAIPLGLAREDGSD